jgi:hypothetical protein
MVAEEVISGCIRSRHGETDSNRNAFKRGKMLGKLWADGYLHSPIKQAPGHEDDPVVAGTVSDEIDRYLNRYPAAVNAFWQGVSCANSSDVKLVKGTGRSK